MLYQHRSQHKLFAISAIEFLRFITIRAILANQARLDGIDHVCVKASLHMWLTGHSNVNFWERWRVLAQKAIGLTPYSVRSLSCFCLIVLGEFEVQRFVCLRGVAVDIVQPSGSTLYVDPALEEIF